MADDVNKPKHYCSSPSGIECIEIVEHMNFCKGNAIKYIFRAEHKSDEIKDLKKAIWYIKREIERIEKTRKGFYAVPGKSPKLTLSEIDRRIDGLCKEEIQLDRE